MGLTTAAPQQAQASNQGRTQETPLETIKNRIQNLADNYEQIQQQAEQFRNHRMQISEKASLIHVATQHHGIPHKEIYPEHAGPPELDIENLVPEMFGVRLIAEVKEYYTSNPVDKDWRRLDLYLTDETGTVKATLWNEDVDIVEHPELEEGVEVELDGFMTDTYDGEVQLKTPRNRDAEIYLVDSGDRLLDPK